MQRDQAKRDAKPAKPVHPIFVHFPVALLASSVVADLFGFFTDNIALRNTAWWALLGAALGGVVTVVAGVYDMRRANIQEEVHERVHQHMKVGFVLVAAIIGLTVWRWTFYAQAGVSITAAYLDVALLTAGLAGFQGWLGGELVYTYGVFVKAVKPDSGMRGIAGAEDEKSSHHH